MNPSTCHLWWMRMPGQTWSGIAASFLGMWVVMILAMMLPVLIPMLRRYREAVGRTGAARLGVLTGIVGAGYFLAWTAVGMVVFPLGVSLGAIEMQQPALMRITPFVAGAAILFAGALQFTTWKAHRLAGCREIPARGTPLRADVGIALRHGVRLGLD